VCILSHAGRILGSYLHDLLQSWDSSFVAMTQLDNHNFVVSLISPLQHPKFSGCYSLASRKSLPMGVN
jgi:hypothetical protein